MKKLFLRIMLCFMMIICLFPVSASAEDIEINETNFPDAAFREYVKDKYIDKDLNGFLTDAELGAVETINVSGKGISDLTGIEYFTALERLDCYDNQLTSLDVSSNTMLGYLSCYNNNISTLNILSNTELRTLYCSDNQLTFLDVSKNTELRILYCSDNQLTSLNVSNNSMLMTLRCSGNRLSSLDVSKNTALQELYCHSNELSSLDISKNTALKELRCQNNELSSLDISKNTALEELRCQNNYITDTAALEEWLVASSHKGEVLPQKTLYDITAKNGDKYKKGASEGLTFISEGPYGEYVGTYVDGNPVATGDVIVSEGSTDVTLKPAYLETLSVGRHTLRVDFTAGKSVTEFEIVGDDSPSTGDPYNVIWPLILLATSATGVTVCVKRRYNK